METKEEIKLKNDKKEIDEFIKNKEVFENINSPKLIQEILQLSTKSTKIGLQLENNMIKSLLSFNENLLPILDNEIKEDNFNPFILTQNKRNTLYYLNFEQINIKNNVLTQKIQQYNELKINLKAFKEINNNKEIKEKEKLNDEKKEEEKKEEKEDELKKEEMDKKLYLVEHPFISLFEDEINIKEIKDEMKKEYLNKMKDNTNYKYAVPQENNNLHGIVLQNIPLFENDEEDEENVEMEEISGGHSIENEHYSNSDTESIELEEVVQNNVNIAGNNINIHNVNVEQNIVEINENNNNENNGNQVQENNLNENENNP